MLPLLRDIDVRQAVYSQLLAQAGRCPKTLIVNELGLEHGASRVDIAVINGHIRGLEIKAEADNLERLPRQIAAYGRVVDKATLIAADRHVAAATELLPLWWGIISVAKGREGAVIFRRVRPERINRCLDAMTLARLLWRPEVIKILRSQGVDEKSLRSPRTGLYTLLVASMSRTKLRDTVRTTLKCRENWRDRIRPSLYDGSSQPSAKY
jgi:hypothetical protein